MTEFFLDVRDFDANLLPADAQTPGTDAFRDAVVAWFTTRILASGSTGIVAVDDKTIHVQWSSPAADVDPVSWAVQLLQDGKLKEGAEFLEALAVAVPDDVNVRFNLGMALSDLGQLGDAARHLERAVALAPSFSHAWVALGVAQQRMGDAPAARVSLSRALEEVPTDGYAHRNLASVLMSLGEVNEAGHHFREASRLLPEDPAAQYGLALWLLEKDQEDQIAEADDILNRLIRKLPNGHPFAEMAKEQRSKIAMRNLRAAGGDLRMDAVMYLLGAIERFASLPRLKVQEIGFEIAMLGQRGIDVNDSAQKYTLRTLSGQFSGLHLMSLMYAAFQVLDPSLDIGFDLSREYAAAKSMAAQESRGH